MVDEQARHPQAQHQTAIAAEAMSVPTRDATIAYERRVIWYETAVDFGPTHLHKAARLSNIHDLTTFERLEELRLSDTMTTTL